MNSKYNNYEYSSEIENINLTNQLSSFENSDFKSNNYNKISSYINNYLSNNSSTKKEKSDIKKFDLNEEYFNNYNFNPKNNKSHISNFIDNKINDNSNNKNSLYDFIFSQKKCQKIIKLININQRKKESFFDINPSRNSLHINSLTDNQNISPSKENSNIQDKKAIIRSKKQIISIKKDNSYKNFNQIESLNYQIPIIPHNDIYDDKNYIFSGQKIIKKNHINLIPVPLKNKQKLLSDINEKSTKKNVNIDINTDFDKINKKKGIHKKSKSLFIGNNLLYERNYDLNIKINKNDINDKEERELFSQIHYLKRDKSEKILNKKMKYKSKLKNFSDKKLNCKHKISKIQNLSIDDYYFKIYWGAKSQAGKNSNGKIKINQDSFKVCQNINNINNFNIFILCDGHGKDGHHVSKFVSENIVSRITNHRLISSLKDLNQIYKTLIEGNYYMIKNIFYETDDYLSIQNQFDTYISGTTCIMILQIGKKIICANTGDSRAILIYSLNKNNFNKELLNTRVFPLSLDSKPDLPSELERIINRGGEVHKGKNRKGKYSGPMRIFAKGKDYPGLAMSRSLGDFRSKEYGVICEPSFVEYNLDEYSKYIVLCSDGVWDFMDNESVMKIGNKHYLNNNPNGFCQEILGNASYWWEKEDIVIDDITSLIIFYKI